ncbi:MAG: adenylate/guanylate cyclase domain-containing protein [Candidatus Binatia bacterium]|nr:MAG: adenylate/guanylate cyclase domain-containing protein [Candidatus Binatia bacterium]
MARKRFAAAWTSLLAAAIFGGLRIAGCAQLHLLEERVLDYRLKTRAAVSVADPSIVIVAVDDVSIEQVGRWPWPRSTMANLLRRVAQAEPRVVGVDIVQSEASQGARGAEEDRELAAALAQAPVFVLGYFLDFERPASTVPPAELLRTYDVVRMRSRRALQWIPPRGRVVPAMTANLPEFSRAARDLGYFNFLPDADGTIRRVPLVLRYGEELLPPLSLAVLRQATGKPAAITLGDTGVEEIALGDVPIPADRTGSLRVDFYGPGRSFAHISAVDVLRQHVDPERLRGKIVLVGVTATAVYDQRVTPLDPTFPGVEIHANVIANVLQRRFLVEPVWAGLAEVLALLGISFATGWLVARARGVMGALGALSVIVGYLGLCEWLLRSHGLVLGMLAPTSAALLTLTGESVRRYLWEERERRKMRRALELYLSPAAAALVSEHPERLSLGGEKVECTVLFSDVKDFTSLAEQLPPETLVELLNSYLGAMTKVVFRYEGMLDKYIGDGIMAVWGVPLAREDHAAAACRAALAMQKQLDRLPGWQEKGWPHLHVRIGINSGPVVFGNMGSADHLSLTVVGDNVNLAARLEGLNKLYGTGILIAETTARALPPEFLVREVDTVRVKGREQAVRVFELIAEHRAHVSEETHRMLAQFAEALERYRRGDFAAALRGFAALANGPVQDRVAQFFLARCRAFLEDPPATWDAVTSLDEK